MKACIFGGHYGSEGKGSFSEYLIRQRFPVIRDGRKLIVAGENAPNSGHTNSVGKTRNIPVSSFFADAIILGPDSVIDPLCLGEDILLLKKNNSKRPPIFIHNQAAITLPGCGFSEKELVKRISSTGTGSGAARYDKCFFRNPDALVREHGQLETMFGYPVIIINTQNYIDLVNRLNDHDWIFECSQGTLLDVNFGRYPYVTSRSTLPRVAIERNGLGGLGGPGEMGRWEYFGVYRTYPIRTGGPSGPTGGKELTYEELEVEPEIASVTKRIRRIFEFDAEDFINSLRLTRPTDIAFTHVDYINLDIAFLWEHFFNWLRAHNVSRQMLAQCGVKTLYLSSELSKFSSTYV